MLIGVRAKTKEKKRICMQLGLVVIVIHQTHFSRQISTSQIYEIETNENLF